MNIPKAKQDERLALAQAAAEWLADGGKITECPPSRAPVCVPVPRAWKPKRQHILAIRENRA